MTKEEKLKIKASVLAEPSLFSARYNRDYETMAIHYNDANGTKLTPLEMHACMAESDE